MVEAQGDATLHGASQEIAADRIHLRSDSGVNVIRAEGNVTSRTTREDGSSVTATADRMTIDMR